LAADVIAIIKFRILINEEEAESKIIMIYEEEAESKIIMIYYDVTELFTLFKNLVELIFAVVKVFNVSIFTFTIMVTYYFKF